MLAADRTQMAVIDDDTLRFGRILHYAGVLVLVVCLSTGYSMLHAPAVELIHETSNRIDELMQSVKNAPIIRHQHGIVSQKLQEVTTRIANVESRVPLDADDGEFLIQITELAEAEKLVIKHYQPAKPEPRQGYSELQITFKGEGSFGSICAFIDRLNKLARLSKIKDLTLASEIDAARYPMTATLVIYFGLQASDVEASQENRHG